ncbi:MAG TPA: tetratricopeptide repeat protein, partial [Nitrospiria bacterium]
MKTIRFFANPQPRKNGMQASAIAILSLWIGALPALGAPMEGPIPTGRLDRVNADLDRIQLVLFEKIPASFVKSSPPANRKSNPNKSAVPEPEEVQRVLSEGLLAARMFPQAERILKDLAIHSPREPVRAEAWFRLQKLYALKNDYPQSLGGYSKITLFLPREYRPESDYLAVTGHIRMGNLTMADEVFNQMEERTAYYPFALHSLGLAHLRKGRAGSAGLAALKKLSSMNPGKDPTRLELINRTRVTLGFWLMEEKKNNDALGYFSNVSPGSRYRPMGLFGAGRIYFNQGECVEAIAAFEEAIELAPADAHVLEAPLLVADCFGKLNAFSKAVDRNREALRFYSKRHEDLSLSLQEVKGVRSGERRAGGE